MKLCSSQSWLYCQNENLESNQWDYGLGPCVRNTYVLCEVADSQGFATWRGIDLLALGNNIDIHTTVIRPAFGKIDDCKASAPVQDTSDHVRKVLDLPLPLRGCKCVHMGLDKNAHGEASRNCSGW